MLLQPKKFKFKKQKKGKLSKINYKSNKLKFGSFGLKATNSGFISSTQLETARQAISRKIKKSGKIWIRIYPNVPITAKPLETRMGKGKGNMSHWACRIFAGTILFELDGVSENLAKSAFKTGSAKLPIKSQFVLL